ncbi:hypothetical protein [Simplicispira psychrophila]|uniref:hypothetical protein n=1 Tax=Simplicispira psychrophila TaxID=80882 RepID=UPI00048540FD|nr:hypothetical protein [Simplicispira psychrophila]
MPETPRPSLHHDAADNDLASVCHPAKVRVPPGNNGLQRLLTPVRPLGRVRMVRGPSCAVAVLLAQHDQASPP